MRADALGMFWEDTPRVRGKSERIVGPLPSWPDTGWRPPTEFPSLAGCKRIAIDTETKDIELRDRGPGVRSGGHIVGVSVGTEDGRRWYFPMRHEVEKEFNLDPTKVLAWLHHETKDRTDWEVCGANLLYDLDYLAEAGVRIRGRFRDVQIAEPLIDENRRSYSLDSISKEYLDEGKVSDDMYRWIKKAYNPPDAYARQEIYRTPPSLVGPYAEGDVDLPLRILDHQEVKLSEEGLGELFSVESRLTPLLLEMRRTGVRVDLAAADRLDRELSFKIAEAQKQLNTLAGFQVNTDAGMHLKRLFDKLGVSYPYTAPSRNFPKGQPSFTKAWLSQMAGREPACTLISEIRTLTKMQNTFVRGYIQKFTINGRIHCSFHQLKGDENGTVSGRFSSSDPNLQNIPTRDPYWGPLIRALFIPEEGERWNRHDWSQIEFRFLCHYGMGAGAEEAREMYRTDPTTDFHVWVAELCEIDRKPAKNMNFGLVYGMGEALLAYNLGISIEQARQQVFNPYHERLPFIKNTYNTASSTAQHRGYVKTIMGRRSRFELWQPSYGEKDDVGLPLHIARARYETKALKRAYTHKALNRVLQGSAGDTMKKAMVDVYESGLCDVIGVPMLTVHDELANSADESPAHQEALRELKHIMEHCVKLSVPLVAEREVGPSWGQLEAVK